MRLVLQAGPLPKGELIFFTSQPAEHSYNRGFLLLLVLHGLLQPVDGALVGDGLEGEHILYHAEDEDMYLVPAGAEQGHSAELGLGEYFFDLECTDELFEIGSGGAAIAGPVAVHDAHIAVYDLVAAYILPLPGEGKCFVHE